VSALQAAIPAETVRQELERVLARGELREGQSLLERLIEWLAPHLGSEQVAHVGNALALVLALALVVALARTVRRAWVAFRTPVQLEQEAALELARDAGRRARELADEARAVRARGDARLALRLYFQALLLALGGRGALEWNPAWTQRELLRRGKPARAVRELLEPLVRELEPKEFGRAPVEAADLERLEGLLAPFFARGPLEAREGGAS
jgi:hypothetical protein